MSDQDRIDSIMAQVQEMKETIGVLKEARSGENLEERVHAIAFEESGNDSWWEKLTSHPPRTLDESEHYCRLWGFIYGLAYEKALGGENASDQEIAQRALDAARAVFKEDLASLETIRMLEGGLVGLVSS